MIQILNYMMAHWLDVLGTALGLLYLWLEFRESVWVWVVGAVMPLIYTVVLYRAGLYADCGMEVYYFLAGIYGLCCWMGLLQRGKHSERATPRIGHVPVAMWWRLSAVCVILWMGLAVFLQTCTDSTVPYLDALSTALSIVAMWMLSRKYLEQWWVWFVVDVISVGLYLYKGIYGRTLLYGIYTLMAIYGYWVWKQRMKKATSP